MWKKRDGVMIVSRYNCKTVMGVGRFETWVVVGWGQQTTITIAAIGWWTTVSECVIHTLRALSRIGIKDTQTQVMWGRKGPRHTVTLLLKLTFLEGCVKGNISIPCRGRHRALVLLI